VARVESEFDSERDPEERKIDLMECGLLRA